MRGFTRQLYPRVPEPTGRTDFTACVISPMPPEGLRRQGGHAFKACSCGGCWPPETSTEHADSGRRKKVSYSSKVRTTVPPLLPAGRSLIMGSYSAFFVSGCKTVVRTRACLPTAHSSTRYILDCPNSSTPAHDKRFSMQGEASKGDGRRYCRVPFPSLAPHFLTAEPIDGAFLHNAQASGHDDDEKLAMSGAR